jgi:5-formyltetrahydrofolate cyclo-ligase
MWIHCVHKVDIGSIAQVLYKLERNLIPPSKPMQRHFCKTTSIFPSQQLSSITITRSSIISQQHRKMATDAQTAKKALRKEIKTRLSALSAEDITTQSEQAQKVVLNLDQYKQAKSLSIYLSMPASEAQTDLLVRDALREGKKVFVPFLYAPKTTQDGATGGKQRKVMDLLRLNSEEEYDGLSTDAWGIPSLSADGVRDRDNAMGGKGLTLAGDEISQGQSSTGGLDLVIVPAVAFDAHMNRLGHGAGFYDAFLTRFCSEGKRQKPHLGKLIISKAKPITVRLADPKTNSRSLPVGTNPRATTQNPHSRLGLEGRRRGSWRWKSSALKFELRFVISAMNRGICMCSGRRKLLTFPEESARCA